jgi:hypothetical protein
MGSRELSAGALQLPPALEPAAVAMKEALPAGCVPTVLMKSGMDASKIVKSLPLVFM